MDLRLAIKGQGGLGLGDVGIDKGLGPIKGWDVGGGGGGNNTIATTAPFIASTAPLRPRKMAMEDSNNSNSNYAHYNHKDPSNRFRWTARESFRYMYDGRPWHKVVDFYSHSVIVDHPLSSLFPPPAAGHEEQQDVYESVDGLGEASGGGSRRWERATFKILLSYHGPSFDGWQKQPGLNTVQGLIQKILGRFVDDRKAQQLRDKSLPLEGCAFVAGRTDKGVTALQQVCSFYTWRKDVNCDDIKDAINDAAPGKIRALSVSKVPRSFHPNFTARWRHYFYIFPLDNGDRDQSEGALTTSVDEDDAQMEVEHDYNDDERCLVVCRGNGNLSSVMKPRNFRVSKVNELLRQLEGKTLSYKMFARDTKASRNDGPPTECFMFHARAKEAYLTCTNQGCTELRVMCIELVANRFLRKMVRVLVATAIREAAAGADDDALLKLMDASCRRATAPPAPPDGLCLLDVGYRDFEQEICLIR